MITHLLFGPRSRPTFQLVPPNLQITAGTIATFNKIK